MPLPSWPLRAGHASSRLSASENRSSFSNRCSFYPPVESAPLVPQRAENGMASPVSSRLFRLLMTAGQPLLMPRNVSGVEFDQALGAGPKLWADPWVGENVAHTTEYPLFIGVSCFLRPHFLLGHIICGKSARTGPWGRRRVTSGATRRATARIVRSRPPAPSGMREVQGSGCARKCISALRASSLAGGRSAGARSLQNR